MVGAGRGHSAIDGGSALAIVSTDRFDPAAAVPDALAKIRAGQRRLPCLLLAPCLSILGPIVVLAADPEQPELDEVRAILTAGEPTSGVVFSIMEYDADALQRGLERLVGYVRKLRESYPQMPIVLLSHGEEMSALTAVQGSAQERMQAALRDMIERYQVRVQVCEGQAALQGLGPGDFAAFVETVPSAQAQLRDDRELGIAHITLELVW
jgi:intracellular sulfur oxidation DsrE/DsrF family protein